MKNTSLISMLKAFCLIACLLLFTHCKKDQVEPEACADPTSTTHTIKGSNGKCDTGLMADDITSDGTRTETNTGFTITGNVSIPQGEGSTVTFSDAIFDITTDESGNVQGVEGTGTIPAADGYVEFDKPIKADIGYFTGKWINENRDFCITLKDDISYFVYNVEVSFAMHVGGSNEEGSSKPLTVKVPLGGQILMIMDYDDPMFFTFGELDLLGAMGFGQSKNGNIVYIPEYPVEGAELQSFDGKVIKCATATFQKLLTISGSQVINKVTPLDAILNAQDMTHARFEHSRGINASMELGLPFGKLEDFIEFKIPIADGSAAYKTSLNLQGELEAKAFIRGVQALDDSWWPDFIPIDMTASREVQAHISESGLFEASIQGEFSVQMPSVDEGLKGKATINNDAFTLEGTVTVQGEEWGASTAFGFSSMEIIGTPPAGYLAEFEQYAVELIDEKFAEAEKLADDLKAATEKYEIELSLRGLRNSLPPVLKDVLKLLDDERTDAVQEARSKLKKELSDNGRKWKSDNLWNLVGNVIQPYKDQINQVLTALDNEDNESARDKLESALRKLASMKKIDTHVTVTYKHTDKIVGITTKTGTKRVSVKITVLSTNQVNDLLKAADNVQHLREASDKKVSTQSLVDNFPSKEYLNGLKSDIQNNVKNFLEIGGAGFTYTYKTKVYEFFFIYGGEKKPVDEFNIFDGKALGELITFD